MRTLSPFAQVPLSVGVAVGVIPNGAIGARFSPDGETLYLTDVTGLAIYDVSNPASPQIRSHVPLPRIDPAGAMHLVDVSDPGAPAIVATRPAPGDLTVYDVRDLSRLPTAPGRSPEQLAWVCGEEGTFAFDVTDPVRPRVVLGGPGAPQPGHWLLLGALTEPARERGWPDRGAAVGFYVSAERFWGAYLAPADCPPLGSRGRTAERVPLSPIGEPGRPASWGRGPAPSPSLSDHPRADRVVRRFLHHDERAGRPDLRVRIGYQRRAEA
jgi:hypothetical protein